MDERRKQAYRYLLYQAMLDIRPIMWLRRRWYSVLIPRFWVQDMPRIWRAGALADGLHNLAFFSSLDFNGFDEERFWQDFQLLSDRYALAGYRSVFEERAGGGAGPGTARGQNEG